MSVQHMYFEDSKITPANNRSMPDYIALSLMSEN